MEEEHRRRAKARLANGQTNTFPRLERQKWVTTQTLAEVIDTQLYAPPLLGRDYWGCDHIVT